MKTEYKRDMNHNYLILYGEEEINTDSYQVRMLVGNIIPSLLKCRIQGMDGKFMVYFDITSRQALNRLYEEKKMGIEDLRRIFGGFVKVMEDTAEYLMNPGQLVLAPEYIFTDMEEGQVYFCLMPGYDRDIKEQFQALTEYILPKIDHEDGVAVMLGYGVYRRAMENSFHLEHIKEELYKLPEEQEMSPAEEKDLFGDEQRMKPEEKAQLENDRIEFVRENRAPEIKNSAGQSLRKVLPAAVSLVILAGIAAATVMGYLPYLETGVLLGAALLILMAAMGISWIMKRRTKETPSSAQKSRRQKEGQTEYGDSELFGKNSDFLHKKESPKVFERTENNGNAELFQEERSVYRGMESVQKEKKSMCNGNFGETMVLSAAVTSGPASFVSREPGELATIYLQEDLTVVGKLANACDAVIDLPTVSRIHAKIRKKEEGYYLTDMNSRNGTMVNGRLLLPDEEYRLQNEDEVDFAQARYVFLE